MFGTQSSSLRRIYLISCGYLLFVTGVAKIWSWFGNGEILKYTDPILGVQIGLLTLLVGILETAVAYWCLRKHTQMITVILLAWLSTSFLLYRISLFVVGWRKPCGCLGSLTDALGIQPDVADLIIISILLYFLIGSYMILARSWPKPDSSNHSKSL